MKSKIFRAILVYTGCFPSHSNVISINQISDWLMGLCCHSSDVHCVALVCKHSHAACAITQMA